MIRFCLDLDAASENIMVDKNFTVYRSVQNGRTEDVK